MTGADQASDTRTEGMRMQVQMGMRMKEEKTHCDERYSEVLLNTSSDKKINNLT